jgi:hypothetical protein
MHNPDNGQRAIKIITPRANARDALAVETVLAALSDIQPFALELGGVPGENLIVARGDAGTVEHVLAHLRNAYPQCEFEDLPPDCDPAHVRATVRLGVELRLRDKAYLPIRTHVSREGRVTHDDYARAADPMIGVLSAMDGLQDGEACLAQFVLQPMPDDWSKYWRGSTADVGERAKVTPGGLQVLLLSALGPGFIGFGLLFLFLAVASRQGPLFWMCTFAFLASGAGMLIWRFRLSSPPDPVVVKQKVNQSAFRVWARVFVSADTWREAAMRLEQIKAAFRAYNLPGGNGFVFVDLPDDVRPRTLDASGDPFLAWLPWLGYARLPWKQQPILSVSEVAALWHLPHGESGLQQVAYTSSRRVAPLPYQVADGVWIGTSRRPGAYGPGASAARGSGQGVRS